MKVKFLKLRGVKTPTRGSSKSAGIDLYVPDDFEKRFLYLGQDVLIPSALKVRIPEGYALVANNKSGVATKKGLVFGASVIDEDYTGEIHLHLIKAAGAGPIEINPGDKIIQFILEKQEYCGIELAETEEELYSDFETERGDGGFGSTDHK
jgi:deoxyuridine 5'-triphosphate nucleotidohydrolase